MKNSLKLLVLCSVFVPTVSSAAVYSLSGVINPAQATSNPSNTGNGSGTIAGSYDDVTNLLSYSIAYQDLTSAVTNMHFHLGAPGVAGGVELGVPGPWTSPDTGSATITASNEANLLAGNWYLNIHTANFGGGEIRGQVITSPIPEPSIGLLGLSSLGLLLVRKRR